MYREAFPGQDTSEQMAGLVKIFSMSLDRDDDGNLDYHEFFSPGGQPVPFLTDVNKDFYYRFFCGQRGDTPNKLGIKGEISH